jgi:hypothetical protein
MTTIEYMVGCAMDGGSEVELPVISLLVRLTDGIAAMAFSACACLSAVLIDGCDPVDSGVGIEDMDDAPIAFDTDWMEGSELPDDLTAGDRFAGEATGKPAVEGEAIPRAMLIVGVLLSDRERELPAVNEALPRWLERGVGDAISTFASATSTVI